MGRALFSQAYSTPTVRTEPEANVNPYEKWSRWNAFDPDSDEFFDNAERELFTDTDEFIRSQESLSLLVDGAGSSGSSEGSVSDSGSPMAVGSDDPALLMADAYASVDWEHRFLVAGAAEMEWRNNRDVIQRSETLGYPRVTSLFNPRVPRNATAESDEQAVRPGRVSRPRSTTVSSGPVFLPPSSLRNSTTATEIDAELTGTPPHSPSFRRTVNITPISIPIEPSSPSPISPDSPSTPPDNLFSRQVQAMFTPSPVPTVSPRIYTLGNPMSASPASPTRGTGGPLTNPNARMSLSRINIAPARARVQNAAV